MSRRRAATSLAAGLTLVVIAPVVWWLTQPEPAGQTVTSVNAAAAVELAAPAPATSGVPGMVVASSANSPAAPVAAATPGTTAAESTGLAPTGLASTAEPASAAALTPAAPAAEPVPAAVPTPAGLPADPAPAAPVRIELPALAVDTTVVPVGVDGKGAMQVPDDVSTVGWYRFGPIPGAATGSAVIGGHVDDYRQGVGVFGRLGDLGPGDIVRVVDASGVTREFSVLSREEWSKSEVPLDRLFDRGGSGRLVLITCGGTFNKSTLGYDDNIAVTAVPLSE